MGKKTQTTFIQVLWILVRSTLLQQWSRMASQGVAKSSEHGKCPMGKKHINDFYLNFASTCQDRIFAAKRRDAIPKRRSQELKWKTSEGQKTQTKFIWILRILARIAFLSKDPGWASQATSKEANMKNIWWLKNMNGFYLSFAHTCQDYTFGTRTQKGTPKDSQRSENGKCPMGTKHKRLLFDFCEYLSGQHFCSKDPGWDPKGQSNERKWKTPDR